MATAIGVDVVPLGQPLESVMTVVQRSRERMLGGPAILHRGYDGTQLVGQDLADGIVLCRAPHDETAAVNPQHGWVRAGRALRRAVQAHPHRAVGRRGHSFWR